MLKNREILEKICPPRVPMKMCVEKNVHQRPTIGRQFSKVHTWKVLSRSHRYYLSYERYIGWRGITEKSLSYEKNLANIVPRLRFSTSAMC